MLIAFQLIELFYCSLSLEINQLTFAGHCKVTQFSFVYAKKVCKILNNVPTSQSRLKLVLNVIALWCYRYVFPHVLCLTMLYYILFQYPFIGANWTEANVYVIHVIYPLRKCLIHFDAEIAYVQCSLFAFNRANHWTPIPNEWWKWYLRYMQDDGMDLW